MLPVLVLNFIHQTLPTVRLLLLKQALDRLQVLSPSTPKRSPLTARERLRAARVLSRYSNDKLPAKSELGSKSLDAVKQSEGGKRRLGLAEAPTNLFDDSKRGLPKEGFTFQFPGGNYLLVVGFLFFFISTVMFAITSIVWKVGDIHFNEL
ncbi:hypothetical protein MLD38_018872 [Melastoma candidum]|uniref:Uncharacterized protein n=1 Tax=Melastoma candidum TaxID=119954 RepID=A0ACB9QV86_9MYRT|nr:hypothetical protein MLD38_018872 [Melastoma candidum]